MFRGLASLAPLGVISEFRNLITLILEGRKLENLTSKHIKANVF